MALVVALAGLLALKGAVLSHGAGKRIGFIHEWQEQEGVRVSVVEPGLPADRAGLRAGDLVLAVDGQRLAGSGYKSYDEVAQNFQRGRPVAFQVQREGRVLDLRVVPGAPVPWGLFLLEAFTGLCFLAVALLAVPPGLQGDLRARLLVGYASLMALTFFFPRDPIGWPGMGMVVMLTVYLVGGMQEGLELHLASLITGRPAWLRRRPWIIPLYYVLFLGLGLVGCATYLTEVVLDSKLFPWSEARFHVLLVPASWLGTLAVVTLLALQAFRHPELKGRNQARLVLAATLLSLLVSVAASLFHLIPPQAARVSFSLVNLVYAAAFFVAIFRYDLLDIERVVRRGLIYTTLTTTLLLVFYAAQGAAVVLLSYVLEGGESVWAISLATLLLGLLFAPLRRFVHRQIGQRFFPERQALRQRLAALAGELPALGKLPKMGAHLVESVRDLFLTPTVILLIAEPETGNLRVLAATEGSSGFRKEELIALEDHDVDHLRRSRGPLRIGHLATRSAAFAHRLKEVHPASLLVPLFHQERLVGALIVGPKAVGSYPAEELDLLTLLAHHVAIVLENARLFESATYESLTGLLRREAILEQLDRELERAQRYGRPLSVALADLDDFKKVNDRHGHLAGDALLRQISRVIAGELRGTDWIGRYGGEEFLLILPETDLQQAGVVAEKIRARVQSTVVPSEEGAVMRVTLSVGLASLEEVATGEAAVTARDLIAAADRSLYSAKNHGRNRVHPMLAVLEGFAS